jgi:hypothetical protein
MSLIQVKAMAEGFTMWNVLHESHMRWDSSSCPIFGAVLTPYTKVA